MVRVKQFTTELLVWLSLYICNVHTWPHFYRYSPTLYVANVSVSWPPSYTAILYVRQTDAKDAWGPSLRPCLTIVFFVVLLQPFHPCCITDSYNFNTYGTHFVDRRKILQTGVYILTRIDNVLLGGILGGILGYQSCWITDSYNINFSWHIGCRKRRFNRQMFTDLY